MRLLAALPLFWVGLAHAGPASLGPNYDVKADVTETCAACHGLRYLDLAQGYDTPAEWSHLIASMVKLPQERDRTISQYLAAN
jgi:mono/diheme cytochrome c family protein